MVRHHETLTRAMRAPGVPAAPTQGRQDSGKIPKAIDDINDMDSRLL